MKKTVLTKYQRILLQEFVKNKYLTDIFYLTGGTALAEFYLKHRYSDDLDFFTQKTFDDRKVDLFISYISKMLKSQKVERQHIYDRFQYIFKLENEILKVEFVKYEFPNLRPLIQHDSLFIADIYDIAVNKLFTILDRMEIKDYIDLYYLLKKYPIKDLLSGIERKYGFRIDPISLGGDLLKVRKLDMAPRMIKRLTKNELIKFFENEAFRLKNEIFPI